jgi:hypothetical protein
VNLWRNGIGSRGWVDDDVSRSGSGTVLEPPAERGPRWGDGMAYEWPPWSGTDPAGLARRVLPDGARYLGSTAGPLPASANQGERAARVREIVDAVVAQRLSPDPVSVHSAEVQVRTPAEVLDGLASSLDVGVLLCGACLGSGLLPILVLTAAGSVVVLVDLQRGLFGWDSAGRLERSLFDTGACVDTASVREIARRGDYLAIDPMPLLCGVGTAPGFEDPFTAAARAGAVMLETAPVRFAVDLATEWCGRRVEPMRVGCARQVVTSPGRVLDFAGDDPAVRAEPTAVPVIRPLPRPVRPLVSPPRFFGGRERELATVRAALTPGGTVRIIGQPGSGRTALLRSVAHDVALSDRYPDGVAYLKGRASDVDELLLDLYGMFYAADRPFHPDREEIVRSLRDVAAVVAVDDAELSADDVEWLNHTALPRTALVLSTTSDDKSDSVTVPLGGLSEKDAIALVEVHAGRTLGLTEHGAVAEISRVLRGHPGSLVLAGRQLRDGMSSADLRESVLADPGQGRSLVITAFQRLPLGHRDQLSMLVATGVPTSLEHLGAVIARAGLTEAAQDLADRGLAHGGPVHWVAPSYVADPLAPRVDVDSWLHRMLGHLVVWAELHADDCDRILADQELLVRMAVWAHEAGERDEAVRLAEILEACLVLAGRWGTAVRLAGVLAGTAAVALPIAALVQADGTVSVAPAGNSIGTTATLPTQAAVIPAMAGVLSAPFIAAPPAVQNLADQLPNTAGVVRVAPSAVNFGSVDIGGGKNKTITVSNRGGTPLPVGHGLDAHGGAEFTVAEDHCGTTALAAGASCTVVIRFSPRQRGSRTGAFIVSSKEGPITVDLRGSGRPTTTSGELTGTYRLTDTRYGCQVNGESQLCSTFNQQMQALMDQEKASLQNTVMPVRQVVACVGTECAYKIDDPVWGNFTIHPPFGVRTGDYTVYDSTMQSGIEAEVRAANEQMRGVLPGATIQIEDPTVSTPLNVRGRDASGKVTAFDVVLRQMYFVRVTAQGRTARVLVSDSFTFTFQRTAS